MYIPCKDELRHADYGIENGYLFLMPRASRRADHPRPRPELQFVVMQGHQHSPFSRIKSIFL